MSREDNPQEWLRLAENDRRVARLLLADGEYDTCAFHCQQAVEKLLKAIIVKQTGQAPPYIHDLRPLFRLADTAGADENVAVAINGLNVYYAATRYPMDTVDADAFIKPLAESAVKQTEMVFTWFFPKVNFGNK